MMRARKANIMKFYVNDFAENAKKIAGEAPE